MLTVESELMLSGLTGREITDFLLGCDDKTYQAWWPGTHLELHVLEPGSSDGHVGDIVLMDEYIGSRRIRMVGEVVEVVPGEKIVWQFRPGGVRLPVRLTLELRAHERGVHVRHAITAGWPGPRRVFDPVWRLYFSKSFAGAMDRHVHTEFPSCETFCIRQLLPSRKGLPPLARACMEAETEPKASDDGSLKGANMKREVCKFLSGSFAALAYAHTAYAVLTSRGMINKPIFLGREWPVGYIWTEAAVYSAVSLTLGYVGWLSKPEQQHEESTAVSTNGQLQQPQRASEQSQPMSR